METQAPTRRDLETKLIEKAWKNPAFKKALLSDPKGMLERHTGQKLPPQVKIFIHEEDANALHLSIPPTPAMSPSSPTSSWRESPVARMRYHYCTPWALTPDGTSGLGCGYLTKTRAYRPSTSVGRRTLKKPATAATLSLGCQRRNDSSVYQSRRCQSNTPSRSSSRML